MDYHHKKSLTMVLLSGWGLQLYNVTSSVFIYIYIYIASFTDTSLCSSYWKGSLLIALDYSRQLCIYIYKLVKLMTVVKGDMKAPLSIATTLRCRGGHYSFPWIAPLTLYLYLIMLSVKQGSITYQFLSLWYNLTWDWTLVSWAIGKHSTH